MDNQPVNRPTSAYYLTVIGGILAVTYTPTRIKHIRPHSHIHLTLSHSKPEASALNAELG